MAYGCIMRLIDLIENAAYDYKVDGSPLDYCNQLIGVDKIEIEANLSYFRTCLIDTPYNTNPFILF